MTNDEVEAVAQAIAHDDPPHEWDRERARNAIAALDKVRGDGWMAMGSAPKDGTMILAAIEVYSAHTKEFIRWDIHPIAFDAERASINSDEWFGWEWDDYQWWRPLPLPRAR